MPQSSVNGMSIWHIMLVQSFIQVQHRSRNGVCCGDCSLCCM